MVIAPPIRVVIIDDAPRTVDNLKRLLSFEPDIEVAGAALTANGGLDAAREFQPDVIIMDVNLPDLDGIQATEIMSAELPLIPVILISVQEDREYLRRAMQAGARQYLVKPFSADELTTAIRRVHQMEERKRPRAGEISEAAGAEPDAAVPERAVGTRATVRVRRRRALEEPAADSEITLEAEPAGVSIALEAEPADLERAAEPVLAGGEAEPVLTDGEGEVEPEASVVTPEAPTAPSPATEPTTPEPVTLSLVLAEPIAEPDDIESQLTETIRQPAPPQPTIRAKSQNGEVTVIYSGKGGVGKSTMAANLAAALVRRQDDVDVALVDLDLQFGDMAVMFGLDPPGTMADVARFFPDINAPLIGSYMPAAPGGVRVLASPLSPELADLVRPEHVKMTLDILKGAFDHVIVDLSSHLNDIALEALECADRILLITDLNIPAIKDAKLAFNLFESLQIPRERVQLILNRSDAPSNVTVSQLEAHLHCQVAVSIPSRGKLVLQSIHKAVPVVELFPDSEISQKMQDLIGRLVPLAASRKESSQKSGRRKFWERRSPS
jgi:Flp pilus assembly CpaE family ATPase/DNA-binding NarL/FixJ family response regulator